MLNNTQETIDVRAPRGSNEITLAPAALEKKNMALVRTFTLSAVGLILGLATPAAAQYRGMTAGWPQQTGGNYAAYYPGNNAAGPAYYVARPVTAGFAPAGYAPSGYAPAGGYVQYVPTTAAYANPNYTAAYGAAPMQAQQPRYAYYGAAPVGYGAPVTAGYAPLQSYRVTPAGGSSAGAEAYANYGQPAAINYVPPRFVYRTNYAQVPVYMYRPVTVLQPGTGQPVTCLQPTTTTQCQTQRRRWFSHSWFNWGGSSSCSSSGCGTTTCGTAPVAAANYCTTNYCQTQPCGQQPYYNTQPGVIIPTVPGSPTTMPGTIITSPIPAGPSIPPPGTRFPAGSSFVPADVAPSLNATPRGSLGAPPGGTIIPGTPSTIGPGTSLPRTPGSIPSFPVDPVPGAGAPSGSSFGGGAFPSGSNYAPATDPLTGAATLADQSRATRYRSEVTGPAIKPPATTTSPITAPTLHPSIQPVPDPAAGQPTRPVNRAPQLLDPRDKTARQGDQRWAVVPAVWPSPSRTLPSQALDAERSPYRREALERSLTTPAKPAAADASQYDAGGWASSR
jgi:hypothetical protein